LNDSPPQRKAVIPSARAAALRSTALATSLALVVGLSVLSVEAWAKSKVPLPKPRPISRNLVSKPAAQAARATHTAAVVAPAAPAAAPTSPAPVLAPATRQHAALPPPRKQVAPAAVAATSSTSQADKDALENVIELVRKQKPADATQVQASISDPVARKLAEWLILRSDNNSASIERYRAFISANPSWPSQTFLRRRIEAALWDDHRDDATVWSWFENESPISAKGKFALAKVMNSGCLPVITIPFVGLSTYIENSFPDGMRGGVRYKVALGKQGSRGESCWARSVSRSQPYHILVLLHRDAEIGRLEYNHARSLCLSYFKASSFSLPPKRHPNVWR